MGAELIKYNLYILKIAAEQQEKLDQGADGFLLMETLQQNFPDIGFDINGDMPPMTIVPANLDSPELLSQIKMAIDNWFALQ